MDRDGCPQQRETAASYLQGAHHGDQGSGERAGPPERDAQRGSQGDQAQIGQAPACTNDLGVAIANTACVMFNSRGVPIDPTGNPVVDALYLTDGSAVYGVIVSATGMVRTWRTLPVSTPSWGLQ